MGQDDKREGEEGIKVTDKRRFTGSGDSGEAPDSKEELGSKSEPAAKEAADLHAKAMPPIDFATFVLSLATSAQVHLGAIPNPSTGKQERDLGASKQTIDILGILEEKTKGNLSDEEGRLLQYVLHDLRLMYVDANKK